MSADYSGLTRNTWPGTWSPSSNAPIALDTELRGSLRTISGAAGDRLTDIPGQRLQDGMLVYVQTGYSSAGSTYASGAIYQFKNTGSRDSSGNLSNADSNWSVFAGVNGTNGVSPTLSVASTVATVPSGTAGSAFLSGTAANPVLSLTLPAGKNGGIPDAPIDGSQYARKDAGWVTVSGGGNSFDQSLNTTDNPTFAGANFANGTYIDLLGGANFSNEVYGNGLYLYDQLYWGGNGTLNGRYNGILYYDGSADFANGAARIASDGSASFANGAAGFDSLGKLNATSASVSVSIDLNGGVLSSPDGISLYWNNTQIA